MTELIVFNFIYTKVLALTYSTISKYNVVKNRIIIIGTIKGMKRGMLFKIAKISIRNLLWYLINCSLTSLQCSAMTAVIQNDSYFLKTSLFTSSTNFLLLQLWFAWKKCTWEQPYNFYLQSILIQYWSRCFFHTKKIDMKFLWHIKCTKDCRSIKIYLPLHHLQWRISLL